MKALKLGLIIVAAASVTIGLSGMAYAFHSGGVADCDGCHSMHAPKTGGTALLQGTDYSSTCLNCHASATTGSYHVMTYPYTAAGVPPVDYNPGGDFAWLQKTYTYAGHGGTVTENGQDHGHNVVAADFGMTADTNYTTSPGGTFVSTNLACNSCHDPHGKYRRIGGDTTYTIGTTGAPIIGSGSYATSLVPTATQAVGSYRLLAGQNYSQNAGTLPISYPGVPIASAPSSYSQAETTAITQVRVAYGVGTVAGSTTWGQWCATCHGTFHSTGNYVHPIDTALSATIAANYGAYVSSGIMTGTASSSYLSLVPFATNSSDYTVLKPLASNNGSALGGPGTSDQVNCLSCHRAHASGFTSMLRWDMNLEFITEAVSGVAAYPGTDNGFTSGSTNQGRTSTEWQAAYYGRPATYFNAGGYQRVLCNKCHAQD